MEKNCGGRKIVEREKERIRKYNQGKEIKKVPEVEWQVLPRSRP